ncbi:MAG: DinB family protein [Akkermansiaceae bacterium]|nr:DinB family protein [Akkermansiaceae bacterium]
MERLIRANVHYLEQASALLARLDDGRFGRPVAGFYGSSVGGHLRHCIEHYLSFLAGMENGGRVDYDDRERNEVVETRTANAEARVRDIKRSLEALLDQDPPVGILVKMDCGGDQIEWQPSTIGRELQFLVSHTVHHFAMIGGICRALDVELETDFGVAPSTLRHRSQLESP